MPERTVRHKAAGFPPAPSWHELVQPGPKGSAERAKERAEAERVGVFAPPFYGSNRRDRRAAGQIAAPGRLVLHRTRLRPVDGGPRPSVRAMREIRRIYRNAR